MQFKDANEKLFWWSSGLSVIEILELFTFRILTPRIQYRKNYKYQLNTGLTQILPEPADFTIGFLGDLMPINGKNILLSDELTAKLNLLDLLVVNLEGVITNKNRFLAQVHHLEIIDKLKSIYKGSIVINVANNHAGDFGEAAFYKHLHHLHQNGFEVFGYREKPFIEINRIRIYSSSLWSNQKFEVINRFNYESDDPINNYLSESCFNIFLPHWNYEMQRYPIHKHQEFAYKLLEKWDMIVGNHTHCPQAIELIPKGNIEKLLAFSLGNFCYDSFNSNQWHGGLLIIGMSLKAARPKLVSTSFYYTHQNNPKKEIRIKLCNELNYAKRRLEMLEYLKF